MSKAGQFIGMFSRQDAKARRIIFLFFLLLPIFTFISNANALLNENCTVSALNRTAQVKADGTWSIPNVPANTGPVRVRVTCIENGVTKSGQSGWISVATNGILKIGDFPLELNDPPPESVTITSPVSELTAIGETAQLQVNAVYPDGSTKNITPEKEGTVYGTTNPLIAIVSSDGLLRATGIGRVLITASSEAVLSSILITVTDGVNSDTDGDTIPDDWEIENKLNPNDPIDALEDLDEDGLMNKEEYVLGTELNNSDSDGDGINDGEEVIEGTDGYITNPLLADTDGDGISDSLEIMTGTDPTDASSFNLNSALERIEITPSLFTIVFNTINSTASKQLTVTGYLMDGTTIDLTSKSSGTNYLSSDLNVASFGTVDGMVYTNQSGTATIQASNSGHVGTATVTVRTFSPTALSYISIPGFANNVDVSGSFAYVAAGSAGLQVVDVSDPVNPVIAGSVDTPGNANDVKVYGNYAYVAADISGLQIIDISLPHSPTIVGNAGTPGNAWDVGLDGPLVYVADLKSGLQIVNISDPSEPVIVGSVDTPGNAKGVDVNGTVAVVADQSSVRIINVSDPTSPVITGSVSATDARDVFIKGNYAYIADSIQSSGFKAIDIADASNPLLTGNVVNNVLTDTVGFGDFAFGSDNFQANAVPIYSLQTPGQPVLRTSLDFSSLRNDKGTGIDVNKSYIYLTASQGVTEKGSGGDTRLYIGKYQDMTDTGGVSPTVSITSPADGDGVFEGQRINIDVNAVDDVEVDFVSFTINSEVVFIDDTPPYEFDYIVPNSVTSLVIGAVAVDFGRNRGTANPVILNIIQDISPPSISITSPAIGSIFPGGSIVGISVNASDNVNVKRVEFYVNGEKKYTDYYEPYRYHFPVLAMDSSGTRYLITARAIDYAGNFAEDSIEIENSGFDGDILNQTNYISPDNFAFEGASIIINGGTLTMDGTHSFPNITLINGAELTHSGATATSESYLEIDITGALTVDVSSSIDVSQKGYLGGHRGDNPSQDGMTIGNTTNGGSSYAAGGSYGGMGGQFLTNNVSAVYGSLYNPDELGSGGGGYDNSRYGGNGGGLVRVTAGEIVLNGSIKAEGGDGASSTYNGGGSGGGIYISTGIFSGTGTISANGGKNSTAAGVTTGGGGGRIAIYYDDITGFNTSNIMAPGGVGKDANGGAGTIYLKASVQQYGDLIVDNNNISTAGDSTPLPTIGTGISTDITMDTLSDDTGSWRADNLVGIFLNPNTNQDSVFKIISNDATSITIDSGDGDMTTVAVSGDTYQSEYIFDNIEIMGLAKVSGRYISANSVILTNNGILTHPSTTTTEEYRLVLNANTLTIDSTSSIDISEKGYLGGHRGNNPSQDGITIGNTTNGGSSYAAGGSYGGMGGRYLTNNVSAAYGSLYNPDELGSGGGGYDNSRYGGNGGGLLRVTAGEVVLDGSIKAKGGDGAPSTYNGGGSGGGIYINTGILSGTGTISANGGKNSTAAGITTGGGGGRIAIYYDDITGFDTANIMASGGVGKEANGGAGTVYLKSSAQQYGDLIVDNNNISTTGYSTPLSSVGTGTSTDLTLNVLTDDTGSWRADDLVGIFLNPDVNQLNVPPIVVSILSNDATSITVDNSTSNLTDVATIGDAYIGELHFDNLSVINGAAVETLDNIFYDTLDITGGLLQAGNM